MNKRIIQDDDWLEFEWSEWLTMGPDKAELEALATDPGLYRVRHETTMG